MIVKFQKKIEFINDCNCIVDYEELEKAMLWYQDKPTLLNRDELGGFVKTENIYENEVD